MMLQSYIAMLGKIEEYPDYNPASEASSWLEILFDCFVYAFADCVSMFLAVMQSLNIN